MTTNPLSGQFTAQSLLKEKVNKHWFIKYKVYHLFFWCVYHFAWSMINGGAKPIEVLGFIVSSPKFIFYVFFQALAVYFNLYFLIPRYLAKGKYSPYVLYLSITILFSSAIIATGYYWSAYIKQDTLLNLYGHDNFSFFFITYTLPSTLTSMLLAMSIKLTKNWLETRKREQELTQEKLETELKFLRAQFNPHFLFNTINSIFVLIHKNPQMASDSLAKFSDLLRYQLYECNEQQIPMAQEIRYMENFIELQKLRLDENVHITFHQHELQHKELMVAPFIIMPFVENAFKHVSQHKVEVNWIKIAFHFHQHQFEVEISNSVGNSPSKEVMVYRGIGLQNVQRRLDLLYPEQHELTINRDSNTYRVNLKLNLSEQERSKHKLKVA